MNFDELNLDAPIMAAIREMGFESLTEIQEKSIPKLREGVDLIGRSQTGTGKTLAFAIPAIEKTDAGLRKPQVLVLLPTRELALQVAGEFEKLLAQMPHMNVSAVFGGASMEKQLRELRRGAQIVVGTPGRVMDHLRRKTLKTDALRLVVLDEADEMLNMGFREDIEMIFDTIEQEVQTVLFSATMPEAILKIAEQVQTDPERIEIRPKQAVAEGIEQRVFTVSDDRKLEALTRLLDVHRPERAMIFCNTKSTVDEITGALQDQGYSADRIHGDMRQESRLTVLNRFSNGQLKILVATDVAARGIDVDDVDIVFNYDVPAHEEYYVHRIGRTGRAGKKGLSLTLARRRDLHRLRRIAEFTNHNIERDLIPTGEIINKVKIDRFKHRFMQRAADDDNIVRYLNIIDEISEQGFEPRFIAAVLLRDDLPLTEGEDLNISFESRERKSHGRDRKGGRKEFAPSKTRRLFINVGKKDGARPRDVLGAICGECGISSADVGEIEMYSKFTFVDIADAPAKKVVQQLNGKHIKGRRVHVEVTKVDKPKRKRG